MIHVGAVLAHSRLYNAQLVDSLDDSHVCAMLTTMTTDILHAELTALIRQGLRPGVPDLAVVHNGRIVMVEIKTDTGRLSPVQKLTIADLDRCGVPTVVARSLQAVIDGLEANGVALRQAAL